MQAKLIRAIKPIVQAIPGIQPRSVFFTPHDNYMPSGTLMPAVGIKDGTLVRREQPGAVWHEKYTVELTAWVDMTTDGEGALVGDDGILLLVEKIEQALDGNNLGLIEVIHSWPLGHKPSQFFSSRDERWLVKKSLSIEYEIERLRAQL